MGSWTVLQTRLDMPGVCLVARLDLRSQDVWKDR